MVEHVEIGLECCGVEELPIPLVMLTRSSCYKFPHSFHQQGKSAHLPIVRRRHAIDFYGRIRLRSDVHRTPDSRDPSDASQRHWVLLRFGVRKSIAHESCAKPRDVGKGHDTASALVEVDGVAEAIEGVEMLSSGLCVGQSTAGLQVEIGELIEGLTVCQW